MVCLDTAEVGISLQTNFSHIGTMNSMYPKDGVIRDVPYLDLWEMEKKIDLKAWSKWNTENWHWPIISSLVYLVTIFGIQEYMRMRKPYNLRKPLLIWNVGLALFSITGLLRCLPGFLDDLSSPDGLYLSICKRDRLNAASAFWGIAFAQSKFVEFGDTLFIVLRKQPLIFLHYYHHVTVLGYAWISLASLNSTNVWFGIMNYGVHSIMYSYYALKALQVKVPRPLAMTITVLQLLQMFLGVGLNFYVLGAKYQGRECATATNHVYCSLLMYGTYSLLFAKFFADAYLNQQKTHRKSG